MAMKIIYETGTDGFGGDATSEDHRSFEALVAARLVDRFSDAEINVDVDPRHLESRVRVIGAELDEQEIRQWIGVDVWEEWCGMSDAERAELAS